MSETVRSLGSGGLGSPRRGRRGGGGLRAFLLIALVGALAYGWWTTRDTQEVVRLIPGDHKYWLVVTDVGGKREKLAQSDALRAVSQWLDLQGLDRALNREINAPDWVVNNLVGQSCYITGNDLKEFQDVLVIARMTRLGTLLERFHGLVLDVEKDRAGGLGLRKLAGQDAFYASRGRVLVISPSRDALIRALTLRDEDSAYGQPLGRILGQTGSEDLQGSFSLAEDDPLGSVVSNVGFALRLDPKQAKLKYRAALRPDLDPERTRLIEGTAPQTLTVPEEGMLVVSGNFGKPVPEVWTGLGDAFGWELCSPEQWAEWRALPEDGTIGMAAMLTSVLESAGPGFCVNWYGTDLNEMIPVPELVGTFDRGRTALDAVYAAFPPVPADTPEWAAYPRYDAKAQRLALPLMGGPSLEPTAALQGDTLVVSTSSAAAGRVLAGKLSRTALAEPGNLYVRLRPRPCVEALVDAARLLVEMDALKGYTPETFEAEAARWTEKAAGIDEVTVLMALKNGEILGELNLTTAADTTAPAQN